MCMWHCINCSVLVSPPSDSNLSHFNFISHNYSVPLRWILPTLYCKQDVLLVGNQTKWKYSRKLFHSLPVLHITFKSPTCIYWSRRYMCHCTMSCRFLYSYSLYQLWYWLLNTKKSGTFGHTSPVDTYEHMNCCAMAVQLLCPER